MLAVCVVSLASVGVSASAAKESPYPGNSHKCKDDSHGGVTGGKKNQLPSGCIY
jgi:hypothetical protein